MRGKRSSRVTITCHLVLHPENSEFSESNESSEPRVGFIVNRGVGNSVIRHLVVRRLRHVTKEILSLLPNGSLLVVRAKPAAANASSDLLARDLASSIHSLVA